jgi:hypothetical protein
MCYAQKVTFWKKIGVIVPYKCKYCLLNNYKCIISFILKQKCALSNFITYNIPSALIISGNFFECISKTY